MLSVNIKLYPSSAAGSRYTINILFTRPRPLALYGLIALCLALAPWSSNAESGLTLWLRWEPQWFNSGQYWRAFSGHLVHASWPHLGINLLALAVLQRLYGEFFTLKRLLPALLLIATAVDAGLALSGELTYYVGLSGVLHGLFVFAALASLTGNLTINISVLAILTGKVALEQLSGPTSGSENLIGISVAVDAHGYGALGGVLCWGLYLCLHRWWDKRDRGCDNLSQGN